MKKSLSETPPPVKGKIGRLKSAYPLLWGWKNTAVNAAPFIIAWLLAGFSQTAMFLALWFCTLVYCLRENARIIRKNIRERKNV